jgi:hypothetical protein
MYRLNRPRRSGPMGGRPREALGHYVVSIEKAQARGDEL